MLFKIIYEITDGKHAYLQEEFVAARELEQAAQYASESLKVFFEEDSYYVPFSQTCYETRFKIRAAKAYVVQPLERLRVWDIASHQFIELEFKDAY